MTIFTIDAPMLAPSRASIPYGLNWYIYRRTSTDEQASSYAEQPILGRSVANQYAPNSITVFGDFGVTGNGTRALPGREALFEGVETQKRGGILYVREISRLSRCHDEAPELWHRLVTSGLKICTNKRIYEHTEVDYQAFLDDVWKAELDNIVRGVRTREEMVDQAGLGAWLHDAPFGFARTYRLVDGRLIPSLAPIPEEMVVVHHILTLGCRGESDASIVEWLLSDDEENDVWKQRHDTCDRATHRRAVRAVLEDRRFIGQFKTAMTNDYVKGHWGALVDESTFWKCHDNVQRRKKPRRHDFGQFILENHLACGCCGTRMTTKTQTNFLRKAFDFRDYRYYKCRLGSKCAGGRYVRIEGIHSQVDGLIEDVALRAEWGLLLDADQVHRDEFLDHVFPFGFICKEGLLTVATADLSAGPANRVVNEVDSRRKNPTHNVAPEPSSGNDDESLDLSRELSESSVDREGPTLQMKETVDEALWGMGLSVVATHSTTLLPPDDPPPGPRLRKPPDFTVTRHPRRSLTSQRTFQWGLSLVRRR